MTLQAVLEVADAFIAVLGGSLCLVMAGIAGPDIQCRLVTTAAGIILLAMIHREGVRTIVTCWTPTRSRMTLRTCLPREHSDMVGGIGMTTLACGPQSGKLTG